MWVNPPGKMLRLLMSEKKTPFLPKRQFDNILWRSVNNCATKPVTP